MEFVFGQLSAILSCKLIRFTKDPFLNRVSLHDNSIILNTDGGKYPPPDVTALYRKSHDLMRMRRSFPPKLR